MAQSDSSQFRHVFFFPQGSRTKRHCSPSRSMASRSCLQLGTIRFIKISPCFLFFAGFQYKSSLFSKSVDGIMELSFMLDVALNFFTTYLDPHTKEECTKPKMIRMRYLQTWFIPDTLRYSTKYFASFRFVLMYDFGVEIAAVGHSKCRADDHRFCEMNPGRLLGGDPHALPADMLNPRYTQVFRHILRVFQTFLMYISGVEAAAVGHSKRTCLIPDAIRCSTKHSAYFRFFNAPTYIFMQQKTSAAELRGDGVVVYLSVHMPNHRRRFGYDMGRICA